MKKREVGISASPICVLESSVPGFLERAQGVRFSLQSTVDASGIVEYRCLAGAKCYGEFELAYGILNAFDDRVIIGKKNACSRILRHLLEVVLQSRHAPLPGVAKRFLFAHHFERVHDR